MTLRPTLLVAPCAVVLLAARAFALPPPATAPAVEVQRLETQGADRPLGIGDPKPRLSWRLASTKRGVRQAAFQVRVATTAEGAQRGPADLWDSDEVAAADPWAVYGGKPLA